MMGLHIVDKRPYWFFVPNNFKQSTLYILYNKFYSNFLGSMSLSFENIFIKLIKDTDNLLAWTCSRKIVQ